jgi:hypothetical protein
MKQAGEQRIDGRIAQYEPGTKLMQVEYRDWRVVDARQMR